MSINQGKINEQAGEKCRWWLIEDDGFCCTQMDSGHLKKLRKGIHVGIGE